MTSVKVVIDRDMCCGHGRCYAAARTIFTDDEAGYPLLLQEEVSGADVELARLAARRCPEDAISILPL